MNEYEETQTGKQLSDDDEIIEPESEGFRGNVMHALTLYRSGNSWVYDDEQFGRKAEPLVLGASEILDQIIVFDLGTHTRNPVSIIFSSRPFPRAHMGKLMGEESGGHWYSMEGQEAWLCPALLDYFETAPPELFVRVTGKSASQILDVGAIARGQALVDGNPDWAEVTRWPTPDDAYPTSDPKHPDWHSIHADYWDGRER